VRGRAPFLALFVVETPLDDSARIWRESLHHTREFQR